MFEKIKIAIITKLMRKLKPIRLQHFHIKDKDSVQEIAIK